MIIIITIGMSALANTKKSDILPQNYGFVKNFLSHFYANFTYMCAIIAVSLPYVGNVVALCADLYRIVTVASVRYSDQPYITKPTRYWHAILTQPISNGYTSSPCKEFLTIPIPN